MKPTSFTAPSGAPCPGFVPRHSSSRCFGWSGFGGNFVGPALCRRTGVIRANPGLYSPDSNAESRERSVLNIPFPKRSVLSCHNVQLTCRVSAPLLIPLSSLVSIECCEEQSTWWWWRHHPRDPMSHTEAGHTCHTAVLSLGGWVEFSVVKKLFLPSEGKFPSSLVWAPCRGCGDDDGLSEQSSFPQKYPGSQAGSYWHTGQCPWTPQAKLCCALLPAHRTWGELLQLLEKAREDEKKFLLKASGTSSCHPDAPSQVATELVVALFGACPKCLSPAVEIFHYFYTHLAMVIFHYK